MTENIEDLEASIQLNKEILSELLEMGPKCMLNSDTEQLQQSGSLSQLLEQNNSLERAIRDSIQEIYESNGRSLINEQIHAEYLRKEQELQNEYSEKLSEISDQNVRKDRIIKKLTEKKQGLEKEIQSVRNEKSLIIISPSPSVIEKHLCIEERRETMQKLARKVHFAQKLRDNLIGKCNEIWEDCIKVHALLKNPTNRKNGLERQAVMALKLPERDFNFEFKYDDETDSEDEFLSSPFPNRNSLKTSPSPDLSSIQNKLKRNSLAPHPSGILTGNDRELEQRYKEAHDCVEILKSDVNALTAELVKITEENESLLLSNEQLASLYRSIK